MVAALALAPLDDIVRPNATVCELLSPSGSTTEFSQSCAQMRPPFFCPPPSPADFDWVRFNLTLILSISDTERQICLTLGWT